MWLYQPGGTDTPEGRSKAADDVGFSPDGRLFGSDNSRRVYAFTLG